MKKGARRRIGSLSLSFSFHTMKFGKTLLRNQLPEWSKNYISYKALKKSINEAAGELPPSEEVITGTLVVTTMMSLTLAH